MGTAPVGTVYDVRIPVGEAVLMGSLVIVKDVKGLVVFAHGSGSSRFSPRNRYVAGVLQQAGLGTLLMDLLTREEEAADALTGQYRFDVELLSYRLVGAAKWVGQNDGTEGCSLGYFGSSTGAAAALIAAATYPDAVRAVVSRGGRPDLAINYLSGIKAPVLLIVGGDDAPVIEMNERAMEHISVVKKLEIVPGATHLFEEAGKLEVVAKLAADWFTKFL